MGESWRDRVGLYAGFAATGIGLALPGALLPVMLDRWRLGDARGGMLLFCLYAGATVGALASRGRMARAVARGAACTAAGALGLAMAGGARSASAAMFVFGAGLGATIAAITLLQSQKISGDKRTELTRLNLLWAAGACAGPSVGLGFGRGAFAERAPHVFLAMAVVFALFALWVGVDVKDPADPTLVVRVEDPGHAVLALLAVGWPLLILVFCETGVESSAGGWLAAYASRESVAAHAVVGAATCYWAGLLGSRLVFSSRRMERVPERRVLLVSIVAMICAFVVLLVWRQGTVTMLAAAALGFAQGPLYPLLMALALRRCAAAGIFVVAGVGSSLLPLATGAVSGSVGSLRAGLGVPLLAVVVMAGLAYRVKTERAG